MRVFLSILCSNDKIYEKNCLSYFSINISQTYIVTSNFFRQKNPLEFGIRSYRHSQRHTNISCFVLFIGHLVFYEDRKQTLEVS